MNTNETLALIKEARQTPDAELAKAWTQSGNAVQGITAYSLEAPSKKLYPVITPLRNKIPRVVGGQGIQANWRAVTAINTGNVQLGVSQGNRGGAIATATQNYIASFAGLGLEDYVTFEAGYSSEGFEDVKALAVDGLLKATMIGEEAVILGGNASLPLGTTPTPSLSASASGGSLATATYSVICVALTNQGYAAASVSGGVPGSITRTNMDSSQDTYGGGSAQKSANATVAVTGPSGSISASVTAVNGAVGYAWYWGTAGAEVLGAITSINSYKITATAAGTQTAASMPSSDNSTNSLVFDGCLTQFMKAGSGSYVYTMPTGVAGAGTPLTGDGAGGIVEIDAALRSFWDNYKLSPDAIYVNAQEQQNISAKILAGQANSAHKFTFTVEQGLLAGGVMVRSYLNKFSMTGAKEIPILLHPTLPPGTIMFYSDGLPYPVSNVGSVMRMLLRRDYYQIEWPIRTRKYEYGVYFDGVLQNYFPPAFGLIRNIANG